MASQPPSDKAEGFDANFRYAAGEDQEFYDRWQRHGCAMIYAPEVVVRHSHFLRFQTFDSSIYYAYRKRTFKIKI